MRYCVFCGSSAGSRPEYIVAARELGRLLVQRGIGLVYGGASVGLMGALADAVLETGGEAIGVMPQFLVDHEIAHRGLTELRVTRSMHERKALMASLSDGFIAMPGGIGTLEEIFEIWTWAQLGRHHKPCALLNTCGFYDGLGCFLDTQVEEKFLRPAHRTTLLCESAPSTLLAAMHNFRPAANSNAIAEKLRVNKSE
ncbi:MAG: TIGR00730 family Rossman fold protein [Acidobacteriota bacterium]|nr:TIGR00730 family Rossman fold protein [Acidobacteriota bacterium]